MFDRTVNWAARIFSVAIWGAIIAGLAAYIWISDPDHLWSVVSVVGLLLPTYLLVQGWIVDPLTQRMRSLEYDLQRLRGINQNIDALHNKIDRVNDRLLRMEMERQVFPERHS